MLSATKLFSRGRVWSVYNVDRLQRHQRLSKEPAVVETVALAVMAVVEEEVAVPIVLRGNRSDTSNQE